MLASFTATLARDEKNSGWIHARWAESKDVLQTGKPVKIRARVDDHQFEATLMPLGDGAHMLPIRAAIRKAIKKDLGDIVSVTILDIIGN